MESAFLGPCGTLIAVKTVGPEFMKWEHKAISHYASGVDVKFCVCMASGVFPYQMLFFLAT